MVSALRQVKVVELNKEREDNEDASKLVKSLKQVISEAPEHIADMLIKDISHTASEYYSEISSDSNKLEWESSYELFLNDYIDEINQSFDGYMESATDKKSQSVQKIKGNVILSEPKRKDSTLEVSK